MPRGICYSNFGNWICNRAFWRIRPFNALIASSFSQSQKLSDVLLSLVCQLISFYFIKTKLINVFRTIYNLFQIENSEEKKRNFREIIKLTCKPINFLKNIGSLHQDTFSILYFFILRIFEDLFFGWIIKKNVNCNNQ